MMTARHALVRRCTLAALVALATAACAPGPTSTAAVAASEHPQQSTAAAAAATTAASQQLLEQAGLATATPAAMGFNPARLAQLDKTLRGYIDRGELAGASVLIARNGKVVHLENFGYRDLAAKAPMTTDTIVRIWSMTKPVTAAAVMAAVEDGEFKLSDPVAKYVPELADVRVYAGDEDGQIKTVPTTSEMTIAQLLTHTAGFTMSFQRDPVAKLYRKAGLISGRWAWNGSFSDHEAFVQRLAQIPLLFQPGDHWYYGQGYNVAALIIERTTGMPYREYVNDKILEPLGMDDTAFQVPKSKRDRFASMYAPGANGELVTKATAERSLFLKPPPVADASGGLVSTMLDYYRFAHMLANGGELHGVRVLQPASVRKMMTNHLDKGQFGQLAEAAEFGFGGTGTSVGFGYGGAVIVHADNASRGAYLWGGAASTTFFVDADQGIVAILMTQLLPSGTYPLGDVLRKATYQALDEQRSKDASM